MNVSYLRSVSDTKFQRSKLCFSQPLTAPCSTARKFVVYDAMDPGLFKFEAKTKTESGVKFTTNGQRDAESGKVLAGSELTSQWPDYGLKYVEKWNTDNQLVLDVSVEDKIVQGLKTSFVSSFNPSSNKKKGTVKLSYKHDYVNVNTDVDMDYAGPIVKGAFVCGYKSWLVGYQMALNTPKKQLIANNFSLGYDAGNHVINATVNNGQDFDSSYYHRLSDRVEGGLCFGWSSANKSTRASLAAKFNASPDTVLKAKAALNGEVGLSLQQRLTKGVDLTLSSILDAKNITAGGHRVGLSLDFEQ